MTAYTVSRCCPSCRGVLLALCRRCWRGDLVRNGFNYLKLVYVHNLWVSRISISTSRRTLFMGWNCHVSVHVKGNVCSAGPDCTTDTSQMCLLKFAFVCFLSDDAHFKTNPKIPGIDLNSVRMLFATLSKPAFSGLLEQVLSNGLLKNLLVLGNNVYTLSLYSKINQSLSCVPLT